MEAEACFNQQEVVKVDEEVIRELKTKAKNNSSGKYRLCMHHSPQDSLHEMFIVRGMGDYGRPEKHSHSTESHMIIEGILAIVIFTSQGEIQDYFELSGKKYYSYRIAPGIYHMSIPLTEQVVYYETKLGPFPNEGNTFADWAPEASETEKVSAYMRILKRKIQDFLADDK